MSARAPQRLSAVLLGLGATLFAAGTLLHPPTVKREDLIQVVVEGATPMWLVDHWLLALSSIVLTLGFAGLHSVLAASLTAPSRRSGNPPAILRRRSALIFAAPMGLISAVLWVGIFLVEATGWPIVAAGVVNGGGAAPGTIAALLTVADALWSMTLALGYAAGVLFTAAVALWSVVMIGEDARAHVRTAGWIGLAAGIAGIVAQPLAWAYAAYAFALLLPVVALLGLWLLLAVWRLWRRGFHLENAHSGEMETSSQ